MEAYINGGIETSDVVTTEVQISLPQAYAYAMGATAADIVERDGIQDTTEGGTNGARTQHKVSPLLSLAMIGLMTLALF